MKKTVCVIVLFGLLLCLLVSSGSAAFYHDDYGHLDISCNVENATVELHYHYYDQYDEEHGWYGKIYHNKYSRNVQEGHALIPIRIGTLFHYESLNITAEGYYPQNFVVGEFPMPENVGQTVTMTVNLVPIVAESPVPVFGIICGLIVSGVLIVRRK